MSWDCPYWNNEICMLNGMTCAPGKGHCVLKNRFQIISGNKDKNKENKMNTSIRKKRDQK